MEAPKKDIKKALNIALQIEREMEIEFDQPISTQKPQEDTSIALKLALELKEKMKMEFGDK